MRISRRGRLDLHMHEPFSLLVPVYDGDRPDHIRRAMRSAVDDQTVRPDQVVIVRAGLYEFVEDTNDIVGQRVPPTDPAQIRRYARMHDPFNHPTVVYRRQAVLAAGGYGDLPLMEDYALFARMLADGARPANVAEPLVFYRVGAEAFRRRGGARLLRSELRLQREFLRRGFTSPPEYLRNVIVRGGYRLIPWWLR